ncbi:MAG: histidine phosphatase family protein [Propioniciclava sp.]|jgi:broad specificity phosphatase PhoE
MSAHASPGPRTRLVLVRHGETDSNASGRFQGQADIPLNDTGRAQAGAVAARMVEFAPARIVASDLSRAQATASAIAEATGAPLLTEPLLREINIGAWEGKTAAQVALEYPWYPDALRSGEDFRRSPSGETALEAGARIVRALEAIARAYPGQTTVVVGHGLALRSGLCQLVGLGHAGTHLLGGLSNCSWTEVEVSGRWRLVSYNNVAGARPSGRAVLSPSMQLGITSEQTADIA